MVLDVVLTQDLTVWPGLALNSSFSCLALSSAGFTYRHESANPVLKPCPPLFFAESSICVI